MCQGDGSPVTLSPLSPVTLTDRLLSGMIVLTAAKAVCIIAKQENTGCTVRVRTPSADETPPENAN